MPINEAGERHRGKMTDHFLDPLELKITWNYGLPVQDFSSTGVYYFWNKVEGVEEDRAAAKNWATAVATTELHRRILLEPKAMEFA
jgi:hypothetical protein